MRRGESHAPAAGPADAPTICADIGGSFIKLGLVLPDGRVADHRTAPTPTADLARFVDTLAGMAQAYGPHDLHLSLAGLIDDRSDRVVAVNIPAISGMPLRRILSERTGRTVRIGNDGQCFALGEARIGAGRGHAIVLGLILGTGIGGGLIIDGRPVRGRGGVAAELGHGPLVPRAAGLEATLPCFRCSCGQWGCIETIGSARGLERLDRWHGGDAGDEVGGRDSRAIIQAWLADEPRARAVLDTYVSYVSSALSMAINLCGADIVPIGGGLSGVPELVDALDRATRARILRQDAGTLLVAGALGRDAALIGAALL